MTLPSYQEAQRYLDDPHACFCTQARYKHMALMPRYLGNKLQGIRATIDQDLKQFSNEYGGVLVAYSNIKQVQQTGVVYEELPHVHFDILFDAIIFKPVEGCILRGLVNKLEDNHIGCLVHGCFNAAIFKPHYLSSYEWQGHQLNLGDEFLFEVGEITAQNGLIFLRGKLPKGPLTKWSSPEPVVVSKPKKRSRADLSDDEDSVPMYSDPDAIPEPYDIPTTPHQHKKQKLSVESPRRELEYSDVDAPAVFSDSGVGSIQEGSSHKHKKKKSKRDRNEEVFVHPVSIKEELDTSHKKKKKKKSKKEHREEREEEEREEEERSSLIASIKKEKITPTKSQEYMEDVSPLRTSHKHKKKKRDKSSASPLDFADISAILSPSQVKLEPSSDSSTSTKKSKKKKKRHSDVEEHMDSFVRNDYNEDFLQGLNVDMSDKSHKPKEKHKVKTFL